MKVMPYEKAQGSFDDINHIDSTRFHNQKRLENQDNQIANLPSFWPLSKVDQGQFSKIISNSNEPIQKSSPRAIFQPQYEPLEHMRNPQPFDPNQNKSLQMHETKENGLPQNIVQQQLQLRDQKAKSLFSAAFKNLKESNQTLSSSQQTTNFKTESPFEPSTEPWQLINKDAISSNSNPFVLSQNQQTSQNYFKQQDTLPIMLNQEQVPPSPVKKNAPLQFIRQVKPISPNYGYNIKNNEEISLDKPKAEEIQLSFDQTNHHLFEFKEPSHDQVKPMMAKQKAHLPFKVTQLDLSGLDQKIDTYGLSKLGLDSPTKQVHNQINFIEPVSHTNPSGSGMYETHHQSLNTRVCQICMKAFIPNINETLPCGHSFHLNCIQDHMVIQQKGNEEPSCQQCKLTFSPNPLQLKKVFENMKNAKTVRPVPFMNFDAINHKTNNRYNQSFSNIGSPFISDRSFGIPPIQPTTAQSIDTFRSQDFSNNIDTANNQTIKKQPVNTPVISDQVSAQSQGRYQNIKNDSIERKDHEQIIVETNIKLEEERASNIQLKEEMKTQKAIIQKLQGTVQKMTQEQDAPPLSHSPSLGSKKSKYSGIRSKSEQSRSSMSFARDLDSNRSEKSHVSQQQKIIKKYSDYNQELQKQISDQNIMIDNLVKKVNKSQDEQHKNVRNLFQTGCAAILGYAVITESGIVQRLSGVLSGQSKEI